MSDVIDLYRNQKSYEEILSDLELQNSDIELQILNTDNETLTFYLSRNVEIITPGLNLILSNPYPVEVKRVISYG